MTFLYGATRHARRVLDPDLSACGLVTEPEDAPNPEPAAVRDCRSCRRLTAPSLWETA